jgi:UDP-3-O-[3-hydroxymyristoyl] glucosamine N-acyltransferase
MNLSEIAAKVGGTVEGDGGVAIRRVVGLEEAGPGDLTFLSNPRLAKEAAATRASAIILGPGATSGGASVLRVADPYLAFAKALDLFYEAPRPPLGVHPTAVVAPTAKVGPGARIGAYVVIEEGARLGKDACLYPHVVVYPHARIGDSFTAHAGAVVREHCRVGHRVTLQNGAVIGGDGFGFARRPDGSYQKIVQAGIAVLEDDVEVQCVSCVDRATVGVTRVRRGAKIDNQVQVGHSCDIGEDTLLCGQTGLAGSTVIGKGCTLPARVGVTGHLKIGDGVTAAGLTGIFRDVPAGATIAGSPWADMKEWRRWAVSYTKLPDLMREVRDLRKKVEALEAARG